MSNEDKEAMDKEEQYLRTRGVKVQLEWLGASTGEFPTIIIAIISGIIGGVLGAIGQDIWQALKAYLKKQVRRLELERQAKAHTEEGRFHVLRVYIVTWLENIPIVYYATPEKENLNLEYNANQLLEAETDIKLLIQSGKLNNEEFLGINLNSLGQSPYLRFFKEIPSEDSIIYEIVSDQTKAETYAHVLVGIRMEEIGRIDRARKHYELAIQGAPRDPKIRVQLGRTFAKEGDLAGALKHWSDALAIDGRHDIFHYNLARYWALKGDAAEAACELRKASQYGFDDGKAIQKDPAFALVLNHPEIQKIIRQLGKSLPKNGNT